MEKLWEILRNIDYSDLPIAKIVLVVLMFILIQVAWKLVSTLLIKRLERLAQKTTIQLDDELVKVLRSAISIFLYVAALWFIPFIFAGDLDPDSRLAVNGSLKVLTIIGVTCIVYRSSSVLGAFAASILMQFIGRITGKAEAKADQDLFAIFRSSLRLLIFLIGLWGIQLFLAGDLSPQLNETVSRGLNLLTIVIIANVIYRSASVLGQLTVNLLMNPAEETGLTELLRPFLPKIFQAVAIIVIVIKVSELFLGGSTGALVGLLGGAGITLGLLFKDLIYDWFCTVIIYTDQLYKEEDYLTLPDIEGFVQVVDVGFRTTTLKILDWGAIQKVPNSKMIAGDVKNWSQNSGKEDQWGIVLKIKIDGISAKKTNRICQGIEAIHGRLDQASDLYSIRFTCIEENARVIEFRTFFNNKNKDLRSYYEFEKETNLEILDLLEREGIEAMYVQFETDPDRYHQQLKKINNYSGSQIN